MKISAAKSFGLIEGKNQVTVTELAKKILRPKEDGEKERAIKEALAFPPVFAKLLEKFSSSGARIPDASLLSNILHREYNVPDKTSKRVAVVFISSSQFAGGSNASTYNEQPEEENETPEEGKHTGIYIEIRGNNQHKIWIREDSDWDLVESIIKTMRKKKEGLDKV